MEDLFLQTFKHRTVFLILLKPFLHRDCEVFGIRSSLLCGSIPSLILPIFSQLCPCFNNETNSDVKVERKHYL